MLVLWMERTKVTADLSVILLQTDHVVGVALKGDEAPALWLVTKGQSRPVYEAEPSPIE